MITKTLVLIISYAFNCDRYIHANDTTITVVVLITASIYIQLYMIQLLVPIILYTLRMLSPLLIPSPSINIYCLAVFFSYFYWPHNHNTQQSSLSLLISIAHLPAPYLLESPPSSPHLPLPQPPHLLLTARLTNSHVYFLPLLPFPDGGGCCNQRVSLASGWGEEEGPSRAGERYCHSGHPPLGLPLRSSLSVFISLGLLVLVFRVCGVSVTGMFLLSCWDRVSPSLGLRLDR